LNVTIVKRCEVGRLENVMTWNHSVVVRIPVLYNSSRRFLHAEPTTKFDCSAVGSCDPCAGQGRTAEHYQVPKKSGPNLLVTWVCTYLYFILQDISLDLHFPHLAYRMQIKNYSYYNQLKARYQRIISPLISFTNKCTLYSIWQSFKIYIKNHFGLLLHVSVYDHRQGAFTRD